MQTVVNLVLASAVATGGTFVVGYPAGKFRGNFLGGPKNSFVALGNVYVEPTNFTCSYGAQSAGVTVTYNGATTLPAGTAISFNLDEPGALTQGPDAGGSYAVGIDGLPVTGVLQPRLRAIQLGTPVVSAATAVCLAQAIAGAANAVLNGAFAVSGVVTMDVPRNLQTVSSNAGDTTQTITVTGKDYRGVAMSEVIALNGTTIVAGKKAFKTITQIAVSAVMTGNLTVGSNTALGLPIFLPDAAWILKELLNGAAATAGTTVAGLSPNTKSTTTTADVRGTYVPNSVADGTKAYTLLVALLDFDHLGNPQA